MRNTLHISFVALVLIGSSNKSESNKVRKCYEVRVLYEDLNMSPGDTVEVITSYDESYKVIEVRKFRNGELRSTKKNYQYNEQGLLVSVETYLENSDKVFQQKWHYEDSTLVYMENRDEHNKLMFSEAYKYDQKGRKIYYKWINVSGNETVHLYEFNAAGQEIKEHISKESKPWQLKYDYKYEEGKLKSFKRKSLQTVYHNETTFEYDKKGNLLLKTEKSPGSTLTEQYRYNNKGCLMNSITTMNGELRSEMTYKYLDKDCNVKYREWYSFGRLAGRQHYYYDCVDE